MSQLLPESSEPDRCCPSESCSPDGATAPTAGCPLSGTVGPRVDRITLKALLRPDALRRLDGTTFRFCPAADCDVVYFDPRTRSIFTNGDLAVRVGLKVRDHPVPLCYCFGYSLADIQRDLAARGTTEIPSRITAEIKAGHCACEVRNPQGICCLGEVTKAVKSFTSGA